MRHALAIGFILVGAVLAAGCRPGPARSPQSRRSLPEPFVDVYFKAEIEDRGRKLAALGDVPSAQILEEQLDRESCVLSIPPSSEATYDLPDLYDAALPGTLVISKVFYCVRCSRWHAGGSAAAFAITDDGACATNYHVFEKSPEQGVMVVTTAWGKSYPVREVLAASRKDDAAIFRIDLAGDLLTPIPLRGGAGPGEVVAVLSHPGGNFFSFSPGHVSRRAWRFGGLNGGVGELRPTDPHAESIAPDKYDKLARAIEITADYGVGSSGGPVLDLHGNVVGMVSCTAPIFSNPENGHILQMSIHICVPAESILSLIHPAN